MRQQALIGLTQAAGSAGGYDFIVLPTARLGQWTDVSAKKARIRRGQASGLKERLFVWIFRKHPRAGTRYGLISGASFGKESLVE